MSRWINITMHCSACLMQVSFTASYVPKHEYGLIKAALEIYIVDLSDTLCSKYAVKVRNTIVINTAASNSHTSLGNMKGMYFFICACYLSKL